MSSFEFEKLGVWVRAMEFADMVLVLAEKTGRGERKHFRLLEQLEAAAISVPMNIAEGRGRTSPKEFLQFLSYARGSLYETVTLVSLLKSRGWISPEEYSAIHAKATEISRMLHAFSKVIRSSL